jgi:hypothetical protein
MHVRAQVAPFDTPNSVDCSLPVSKLVKSGMNAYP